MNKPLSYLAILSVIIVSSIFINAKSTDAVKASEEKSEKTTATSEQQPPYSIHAVQTPSYLEFAGEEIPLSDEDVKNRVDRELHVNTYWQSNMFLMLKRANRWFPIIEPILQKHGVPDDFKYLAVIESGLTNARSPAGARGFWQFMRGTAKEYGLEVNTNVDERYNLEKVTEAACKYLKKAKNKFGTWTLAAGAYNAGSGKINKELTRQQVKTYFDLLLGEETGRYVPRIVAMKEIMSHPQQYGFNFTYNDLYQPYSTREVAVDSAITNIASFGKKFGVNYKQLKIHNPWLRENKLINKSGKKYYIKLPN